MDGFGNDFSLAFASLVAIINPLGVTFVFRRLTSWATPSERAKLSTRVALYAMAVILGSYFFGRFVLGVLRDHVTSAAHRGRHHCRAQRLAASESVRTARCAGSDK